MARNYIDPLLTQIAKGYRPSGHVNLQILPPLLVNKPTAKIADFGGQGLRIVSTIKSEEGETPTVAMTTSTASAYTLEEHALKAFASDKAAENQDKPFDEQKDKAEFVTDLLDVAREYGLASWMNTYANFSATNKVTLSGTSQFGGSADNPISVVNTAIGVVADAMNIPETEVSLVIPRNVFRAMTFLDEIKELLGHRYEGFRAVRAEELATAFGVKQVIVPFARYSSAQEGQTETFANMWGKHLWATYTSPQPKLKQHCFGYTPQRRSGIVVDKWYDHDRKGWWVRATDEYDQYIMNADAAYMVKDAIA